MNKERTQTAKQIVGFSCISRELISQDFTFKSNQTGKQKQDQGSECAVQLKEKKQQQQQKTLPLSFNLFLYFQRAYTCAAKAAGNASHSSREACGKHTNMCPSVLWHRRQWQGEGVCLCVGGGNWLYKEKWRMHAESQRRCENTR